MLRRAGPCTTARPRPTALGAQPPALPRGGHALPHARSPATRRSQLRRAGTMHDCTPATRRSRQRSRPLRAARGQSTTARLRPAASAAQPPAQPRTGHARPHARSPGDPQPVSSATAGPAPRGGHARPRARSPATRNPSAAQRPLAPRGRRTAAHSLASAGGPARETDEVGDRGGTFSGHGSGPPPSVRARASHHRPPTPLPSRRQPRAPLNTDVRDARGGHNAWSVVCGHEPQVSRSGDERPRSRIARPGWQRCFRNAPRSSARASKPPRSQS